MSFEDLPKDWPQRPLTDPQLVADVLDLVVSDADRVRGAIYILLCRPDDRLLQPCAITELDRIRENMTHRECLQPFAAMMQDLEPEGSILVAIARAKDLHVTDDDRAWHQAALDVCDEGPRLLGVHVITQTGSIPLPDFGDSVRQAS